MTPRDRMRGLVVAGIGAMAVSALLHAAPGTTTVADAAMQNDATAVRALLKQAADVNAAQGDGMTALHWAAMNDDAALAQTLLFAGANLKATTRIGNYTPLILAARGGHPRVLETLLTSGADLKVTTANGTTPLMLAAASGNVETVKLLLDRGADVNAREPLRGLTPMMFAVAANRATVAELLASRGADLKATTKVVDLEALSKDPEQAAALAYGVNPTAPPKEGPPAADGKTGATTAKPAMPAATAQVAGAAPVPTPAATPVPAGRGAGAPPARKVQVAGVDRQYMLNELVHAQGGMAPIHMAIREGHLDSVQALLKAGADINQVTAGDHTSPLMLAIVNGHLDVAQYLLDHGADPTLASENGATPLYAALNIEWAPKALYPQPRAHLQQKESYLDLMKALLAKGADPNVRLRKKVWYSGYSFDLSGVDEIGATPFWRAAYASDVEAMKLLVSYGADPNIRTLKPAGRPRTGDGQRETKDVSNLPPVPVGGPGVTPLQAASGVGYGEGFAANAHRFAPGGMLVAVKYLVDELHVDVNAVDHEGNSALHHAAARGDNEMILYLVSKGADVTLVNREGKTTADMANGPVQRTQPFPETIALLEKLGAKNNHKCISC